MRFPRIDFTKETHEIGRFDRAPIEVHVSFLLLVMALTFYFWRLGPLAGLVLIVIGSVIVLVSILIHELAHASVARRYRIPVSRIDIHCFGGTVHFGWRPPKLSQDLALTLAGPASNFILAALCYWVLLHLPDLDPKRVHIGYSMSQMGYGLLFILTRALSFALYLNLGLGIFNLLPAFPLDGGWIAYRVLANYFNRRVAGIVVGSLGIVVGAVAMLMFFVMALAGVAFFAPPNIQANLEALRAARRGDPVFV